MVIESLENEKIKYINKLKMKKYRDIEKKFIIEGLHLIEEAYKSGLLEEVFLLEGKDLSLDVKKTYVTKRVMDKISALDNDAFILGIARKKDSSEQGPRILMLDDIRDPGNLGTIIRSCVAFNIKTIILSPSSVDIYNDKVLRASEGMFFHVDFLSTDLAEEINELKKDGYKIYGTKVNAGKTLKDVEKTKKYVLIMGNEGQGVKEEVLTLCDEYLSIEMNALCESLNVGVACSILLYELDKRL